MKVQGVYPLQERKAYHSSADQWNDANPSSASDMKGLKIDFGLGEIRIEDKNV